MIGQLTIVAAALFLPESHTPDKRAAHRAHLAKISKQSIYAMLVTTGNRLLLFQYVLHSACVSSITYIFPLWAGDHLG